MKISFWTGSKKKRRHQETSPMACKACRRRRVRCVATRLGKDCTNCTRRRERCTYDPVRLAALKERLPETSTPASPGTGNVVRDLFQRREESLCPGELAALEKFGFPMGETSDVLKSHLPRIITVASPTEFRFLVHAMLAAGYFRLDQPTGPVCCDQEAVHHYAAAVEMIPFLTQTYLVPVLELLNMIKRRVDSALALPRAPG